MMKLSGVLEPRETRDFMGRLLDLPETTLAIEVVRTCNLRCPGCWVGISRDDLWTAAERDLIEELLLSHALELGCNLGISKLSLLGGEPLMHPGLPDIVGRAHSIGYKHVSVTTNGVASAQRLRETLAARLSNITFSIDGSTADVHDALRPSANGKSTFQATMRSLQLAVDEATHYGHEVRINHTIYRQNLHDAKGMVRLAHANGVRKVRMHFSLPGDIPSPDGSHVTPGEWLALFEEMKALEVELGMEVSVQKVYGEEAVRQSLSRKSPYLNLQPDGNLILCSAHARHPDPRKRSFAYVIDGERIRLNPESLVFDDQRGGVCCRGIPALVNYMEAGVKDEIKKAGGMGCIILQSPLGSARAAGDRAETSADSESGGCRDHLINYLSGDATGTPAVEVR